MRLSTFCGLHRDVRNTYKMKLASPVNMRNAAFSTCCLGRSPPPPTHTHQNPCTSAPRPPHTHFTHPPAPFHTPKKKTYPTYSPTNPHCDPMNVYTGQNPMRRFVSVKTSQMRTICTLIWRESCLLVYIFPSAFILGW
jgi:hypothetical protein